MNSVCTLARRKLPFWLQPAVPLEFLHFPYGLIHWLGWWIPALKARHRLSASPLGGLDRNPIHTRDAVSKDYAVVCKRSV